MQFEHRFAEAIRAGKVTTSFRRWRYPQVVAGRRYRVASIGFIDVTAVATVAEKSITAADVRRAGFLSVRDLLDYLDERPAREDTLLYRIDFKWCGEGAPDPRADLAARAATGDESIALRKRLDAMDARSSRGPWTRRFLELIAASPGRRAGDLAAKVGWDTPTFKTHVRRLKALGLTESLEVGYRLSRRGTTLLHVER